ncbi:thermonuclease family protein [bacterium]|nr:thermonuclease family protein [bacterium]
MWKSRYLWLTLSALAWAQPWRLTTQVVRVIDGDTVVVRLSDGDQTVRLDSIDAPERKQPGGEESRRALAGYLPAGGSVKITRLGRDRYGRILGQLYRPDGANVNSLLVRNGQAWVYTKYCRDFSYWTPLQMRARQQRLGVWAAPDPVPPWKFRHPPR